jgi:acyl-coenzyme A thioesterase PaaI-like protein
MAAVVDLGAALRELVETSVLTTVDAGELVATAAAARALTARLAAATRPVHQLPALDDLQAFRRVYNPVTGPGSAFAPPLEIRREGGDVVAEVTLGGAYEGPPGYLHGGMSSLLMDQLLGAAAHATGLFAMTARLELDYRAPVPLQTPLVLRGRFDEAAGRRTVTSGGIARADDPHRALVQARAVFVTPRSAQREAYLGRIVDATGRQATPVQPTDATAGRGSGSAPA